MRASLQLQKEAIEKAQRVVQKQDLAALVGQMDSLPLVDEGLVWIKIYYDHSVVQGGVIAYSLIRESLRTKYDISAETYKGMREDLFETARLNELLNPGPDASVDDLLDQPDVLDVFLAGIACRMVEEDPDLCRAISRCASQHKVDTKGSFGAAFVYELFTREAYKRAIRGN